MLSTSPAVPHARRDDGFPPLERCLTGRVRLGVFCCHILGEHHQEKRWTWKEWYKFMTYGKFDKRECETYSMMISSHDDATHIRCVCNNLNPRSSPAITNEHDREEIYLVANQQQWRVEKNNTVCLKKEHASVKKKLAMKTVRCNLDVCSELMSRLPDFDPSWR